MLRPTTWEQALDAAAAGLAQGGSRVVRARRRVGHERGGLAPPAHLPRGASARGNVDSRPGGGPLAPRVARASRIPTSRRRSPDIDRASAVLVLESDPLDEAPIFDLRLRKAVRRFGARLVVASSAPTALDGGAAEVLRFAPGGAEALLRALQKALLESGRRRDGGAQRRRPTGRRRTAAAPAATPSWPRSWPSTQLERLAETGRVDRRTCATPPPC